jgi:hypothetical protein
MSIDKDDEFLLWLANRLVNKYGENPNIVNRMISIIAKNRLIRSSYTEGNKNTSIAVTNTIRYLSNLQKILGQQHGSLVSKLNSPSENQNPPEAKTDFDNIDIESLFRGI